MRQHESKHIEQISKELRAAGMTQYGFMKLETGRLPDIIHEGEHIKGVVYGRLEKSIDAAMLVATDKRVLFIDCKPLYQNLDEITYDVVSGVKISQVGPFAGVVLHTKVQDYSLRFVNIICAKNFGKSIEKHIENRLGQVSENKPNEMPILTPDKQQKLNNSTEIEQAPDTAVLSTTGKHGAHGAVVHYVNDKDENFYIVTKTETKKAQNILENNQVALTIHQTNSLKYLSINGIAEIEKDQSVSNVVFSMITSPKKYLQGTKMPPVTKIKDGSFVVIKITPTNLQDKDYSKSSW